MRIVFLLSHGHQLCRFARRRNKGNLHPLGEALSALSALSVGHYYLMRIVFYCPTEIKEIKEILLPSPCEAISAISVLSVLSVGHYYLMRIVFYCPTVIGFAASLVEEKRNQGNLVTLTLRSPFCHFCSFCGTLLSHAESFCPTEITEIKEILLPSPCAALSAISVLSVGQFISCGKFLLSHGNKRNQGNLHPPRRSSFCSFCSFCGTIIISCGKFLLSHGHRLCRFARRRNKENQGNLVTLTLRSSFCYFCHFCGTLLSHADSIFIVPRK